MLPICNEVFKQWNLNLNESKTEFVNVHIAKASDRRPDGTLLRGKEEWRNTKLLGSLLCSTSDIQRRINLGNAAFSKYKKVWLQRKKISLARKIQIYEAQVVSVLMYNSSTWAAPKAIIEKLDACHRRHLRYILNYKYPHIISNKNLYYRCNTTPLSERVNLSRWRMLGHVLRSPENTPANTSLSFVVNSRGLLKSRVGRHQMNLFNIIKSDLCDRGINLNCLNDLQHLRTLAKNRSKCMTMKVTLIRR